MTRVPSRSPAVTRSSMNAYNADIVHWFSPSLNKGISKETFERCIIESSLSRGSHDSGGHEDYLGGHCYFKLKQKISLNRSPHSPPDSFPFTFRCTVNHSDREGGKITLRLI